MWRRRLWSRRRRCCRRWRLELRRKILGRCGITTDAGTCCTESRGAAAATAPSREQCRVRHLPSTNVCSGRGGGGLGRLVHCVGYREAEEARAISFCTVIFVCRTLGRETGPDAPPGAIPPSPPPQPKAPAAPAFEGELREGRMNEGEQSGWGPEGGTPSVFRHSLSPSSLTPPFISRFTWGAGQKGGGDPGRGWENREMPTFSGQLRSHLTPPPRAAAAAAAKPSRPLCTKAARSECRLPLATLGAAAAGEPRAQCRSNLPSRPGCPRSALPPRPADPFKPPGLAAAAPGGNAGRGWGRGDEAPSGAAAGRPVR